MTNILLLPLITFAATTWNNGEWDDSIAFMNGSAPVDLTGIAFTCSWRRQADTNTPLRELVTTTANGMIINNGATGILTFAVPEIVMASIPPDIYVADLVATADGRIRVLSAAAANVITHMLGIS